MRTWLAEQSDAFRAAVHIVVIDPSAPYASGIRAALPHAQIAVDHWHLVRLANDTLTDVRQRVAREQLGRRGRVTDPAWAHRRMLLTAGDRLSQRQLARLNRVLAADDPTNEIGAAWGCKELLRQLCRATRPNPAGCGASTTPAPARTCPKPPAWPTTIETWWPHILVFLQHRRHERQNRGLQPHHQAGQTGRLRLPQPRQLPTPHHRPHRGHQNRVNKQRDEATPLNREEPHNSLPPFAMYAPLARSDYYGGSAPSRSHQPTVCLAYPPLAAAREAETGAVPVFTDNRIWRVRYPATPR